MPYSAVVLGLAGLIPFVFMPAAYVFNYLTLTESALYFIQYSAVLLSFFGGVHWWDAMLKRNYSVQMYVAMLPTITGWLCLVFSYHSAVIGVLSLSYLAILMYDKFTLVLPKGEIMSYIGLRVMLTTVVVISHAWMIYLIT